MPFLPPNQQHQSTEDSCPSVQQNQTITFSGCLAGLPFTKSYSAEEGAGPKREKVLG